MRFMKPFLTPLLSLVLAASAVPAAAAEQTPLTLEQALREADTRNLTLEGIRYELDRADGRLATAVGLVLPVASAGLTWNHADHADEIDMAAGLTDAFAEMFEDLPFEVDLGDGESEPTVVRRQDDVAGNVTVSLSLIDAQNWATIRGAKLGKDLAVASVEDARQELLLGVAQAWYAARMTETLVALSEAQVEAAEHHLAVAEAQSDAGSGLKVNRLRAEADLAQVRQDLLDARLATETARDALGVLTGVGGLPLPVGEPVVEIPTGSDDQLVATALSSHSDILLAKASLDLARASLTTTRLQFLPSVGLAWQGSYQITEPTDLGSDDRTRWTLVAQLDIPIYDHFRYGELRQNKAALRQAEAQLRDEEWNTGLEVRQARRDRDTAVAAVDIAGQQASLAAEVLELTLAAYEVGAGSSLEVTDARRSSAAAEVNLATTQLQADLAELSLLRATGGDILGVASR